ncbi:hypothetical protein R6H00_02510 [Actinotignum timonense]|uniref:hypothetical protein n=1 Tax=Actinotignum timonense TaxID=1870995 RepID=UPI002A810B51|nr:hypothetical protein [Actinotignum timonense]MDY5138078.1 hypothetical protein [Actinotignum timonense]
MHRAPTADLVLPATDAEGAIAASAALFASAQLAVLSGPGSVEQAGELAESLGVPVFPVGNAETQPEASTAGSTLAAEFERLGVQHTLLVGTPKPAWLNGEAEEYQPAESRESAPPAESAQPDGTAQPSGSAHPAPSDFHYLPATSLPRKQRIAPTDRAWPHGGAWLPASSSLSRCSWPGT